MALGSSGGNLVGVLEPARKAHRTAPTRVHSLTPTQSRQINLDP